MYGTPYEQGFAHGELLSKVGFVGGGSGGSGGGGGGGGGDFFSFFLFSFSLLNKGLLVVNC